MNVHSKIYPIDYNFAFIELSDEEIAEKFGNRPNLLSEIEPGPRRKHLLSRKRVYR